MSYLWNLPLLTQVMGSQQKGLNHKKSLCSMGYSLWFVKIEPSQNQDLSISLERSYKELLNALISFETGPSKLKLWPIKDRITMCT